MYQETYGEEGCNRLRNARERGRVQMRPALRLLPDKRTNRLFIDIVLTSTIMLQRAIYIYKRRL